MNERTFPFQSIGMCKWKVGRLEHFQMTSTKSTPLERDECRLCAKYAGENGENMYKHC
jgi:hypothetical protein